MTDHRNTSEPDQADAAESLRYVFVKRARCPACFSDQLQTRHSDPPESDGSVRRDTDCRNCGHHFYVVVED